MGNCLTGDALRLIAFHGLSAADFSKLHVVIAPLLGEVHHARWHPQGHDRA